VLTTLVGLQQASDDFNKHEFQALVRELLAAYPYIRTISEIGVMPRAQRGDFEQSMRDDGFLNFRVTEGQLGSEHAPAANRPITMPIRMIEPLDPEFAGLMGFDVLSDPSLSGAVDQAISTDKIITSDAAPIVGSPSGFLPSRHITSGTWCQGRPRSGVSS